MNLEAVKSSEHRASAEYQNEHSYRHQSTPEISPPASAIAPQLGSSRGVASDHPQPKDSIKEDKPGLDSL